MKINQIQNKMQFRALNFSKVKKSDLGYVMDELPKLTTMARNYDVTLRSKRVEIGFKNYYDVIKVSVSPRSKNFLQKLFRPSVSMNFHTDKSPYPQAEGEYLCDVVGKAIKYMEA